MELAAIGSSLCTLILTVISFLHFYRAPGRTWAADEAVPTKITGENLFTPKKTACAAVAFGLLLFALIDQGAAGVIEAIKFPFVATMNYAIALLFFVRGIGNFQYVGFFKKLKSTLFAKYDARYCSPSCFLISTLSLATHR